MPFRLPPRQLPPSADDGLNLQPDSPGNLAFAGGAVTLGGPVKTTEAETTYVLEVKCAASNIATANIPVFIPSNATFSEVIGCNIPDPHPPFISGDTGDIADPTVLGLGTVDANEQVLACAGLPGNVNSVKSLTRGRFIDVPGPGAVAPNLFILSVIGNTDVVGLNRPVICQVGETLPVAALVIDGLTANDAATLTPQGLDEFTRDGLGRCVPTASGIPPGDPGEEATPVCSILVDSQDEPIPTPVLSSKPAVGTEAARLELVPALDDPGGFRRWQVSLVPPGDPAVPRLIAKIAFGLTGFVGSLPENGSFGGCDTFQDVTGFPFQVGVCPPRTDAGGPGGGLVVVNGDLGPTVEPSDPTPVGEIPLSYIVQPMNELDAAAAGLLPWTTYAVHTLSCRLTRSRMVKVTPSITAQRLVGSSPSNRACSQASKSSFSTWPSFR